MSTIRLDSLSPFGRMAVELDSNFSELTRLSGQLERLEIDSEGGLEHAVKLLNDFAARASAIAEGMQNFAQTLQEAQARSEAATRQVAERAHSIQERKQRQQQIHQKLTQVKQDVKAVNDSLAEFRKAGDGSGGDKTRLHLEFERLSGQLSRFIADAQAIKAEAHQAKFKILERDAQALVDVLESSRRKVTQALAAQ